MMIAPLFRIDGNQRQHRVRRFAAVRLWRHIRVISHHARHPNDATGYRIEYSGKVVSITDTEHLPGGLDPHVLKLVDAADVMIYDASYTDAEFPEHKNWGHSTWEEGVRLADAARVGTLVIFHHDPGHDDAFMDQVAADAATSRPGTIVAQEGLVLRP